MNTEDTKGDLSNSSSNAQLGGYWCTFTTPEQTEVATLSSFKQNAGADAVLLPASDPRVQQLINPPEGRALQRLTLETLDDLYRLADRFDTGSPKPLYRGQSNYSWALQTKLERNVPSFVFKETGLETYEYRVLNEAQRRLHHFIDKLPDDDDLLSWQALLRHHAVPTRLLDVTRSLFIACYFAVRDAPPGVDAAVWIFSRLAIDSAFTDWSHGADSTWLRTSPFTVAQYGDPYYWPLPKRRQINASPNIESLRHPELASWLSFPATLDAALRGYIEKPGIAAADPFWLPRRMDAQQGTFLVPFNVRLSFEANLSSFLNVSLNETEERVVPSSDKELFQLWSNFKVIKLRIPSSVHALLRVRLESMNLRELTLFPDAEGAFAQLTSLLPIDGR